VCDKKVLGTLVQLFLAFVVALSSTTALIPLLMRWGPALGFTDPPGPRKLHATPVPRIGGLAMAVGILLPALLTVPLTAPVRGTLLGLIVLLAFGLWDDRTTLGYRAKFLGQIIAVVLCMIVGGIRVGDVSIGGVTPLHGTASAVVTFVFLLGITNAVNLTDGLDGLAGGMALLCLCAIALFAYTAGNLSITTLCLIEAGAVLGFLRFNTHPARIFMGDSGSQVLGFTVGALALLATQSDDSNLSAALPLLLLGLPILDTATVMVTRTRAGRSPFLADNTHLHHRLLALGFAHREAVATLYLLQVGLVLAAYFLRFESDLEVVLTFCGFAALVLGLLSWAAHSSWRVREAGQVGTIHAGVRALVASPRLPQWALIVMISCLVVYAVTVIASSRRVGIDVGVLSLIMLIVLLLGIWRTNRMLEWFERTAAYVSVVLLVYLDQTSTGKAPLLTEASWSLIWITAGAAFVRFWLSPTRRFEVTALDLIVIFLAVVMPNLPGSIALPADLPGGIIKAVILLYVVEMLLTVDLKRAMPRVLLGLTLAVIAGRAFLGFPA